MPIAMGIVMFALGIAIPLLVREPAKGRYTPANKVAAPAHLHSPMWHSHLSKRGRRGIICMYLGD